jgi:hypothetical protein
MAAIRYSTYTYTADRSGNAIVTTAHFRLRTAKAKHFTEQAARQWLGDHGLRRNKIKKLLKQLTAQP